MKKSILSVLVCFFIVTAGHAQGWQWAKHMTSTPFVVHSITAALATDTAGSVFSASTLVSVSAVSGILEGCVSHFGSYSITDSTPFGQSIISKADKDGNFQWVIGTQHAATGIADMATDLAGNLYVLGVYDSGFCTIGNYPLSFPYVYVPTSNSMYFLAKVNSNGNVVWAKNVVPNFSGGIGLGLDYVTSYFPYGKLCVDDTGNVYIAGIFGETSSIGTTTIAPVGISNIFIAKYNTTGMAIWAKAYPNGGVDGISGFAEDQSNLYLAGNYSLATSINFGSFILNTSGPQGNYVVKLDNNGIPLWAKCSDTFAYFSGLAVDPNGSAYVCGNFYNRRINFDADSIVNRNTGKSDAFLVKYNSNGNTEWTKVVGGDSADYAFAVTADHCGNIFMIGGTPDLSSPSGMYKVHANNHVLTIPLNSIGNAPSFVVEYDLGGHFIYNSYIGSGAYYSDQYNIMGEKAIIKADYRGSFCVATACNGTLTDTLGPDVVMTDSGEMMAFVAKFKYDSIGCIPYHEYVGVQEITLAMPDVTLYPNPARDQFIISSSVEFSIGSEVVLYDAVGRQVYRQNLLGNNVSISVSAISPGLYHCVINMLGVGVLSRKLVIIN